MKQVTLTPAQILAGYSNTAGIAAANSRVEMFKSNEQKMKELANTMRVVINTQCESYKNHVVETFADCDFKKIKVSNRVAKARKSEKTFRSYIK